MRDPLWKALFWAAVAVTVLGAALMFPRASALSCQESESASVYSVCLYVNWEGMVSRDGIGFSQPAPDVVLPYGKVLTITTVGVNYTGFVWIDSIPDGAYSQQQEVAVGVYNGSSFTLSVTVGAGEWTYRVDTNSSENRGRIVALGPPPEPWFKIDPLFIFGFVMVFIALPIYLVYLVVQVVKWARIRREFRSKGVMAWVRCVLDPDGPERPTAEDAGRYRRKKDDDQ